MTPLHAGFSGAAAAGALLSGAALWAGVGFGAVYATVGVGLLVLAAILWLVPLLPERRGLFPSWATTPFRSNTRAGVVFEHLSRPETGCGKSPSP
jgi:hypothetical protein